MPLATQVLPEGGYSTDGFHVRLELISPTRLTLSPSMRKAKTRLERPSRSITEEISIQSRSALLHSCQAAVGSWAISNTLPSFWMESNTRHKIGRAHV